MVYWKPTALRFPAVGMLFWLGLTSSVAPQALPSPETVPEGILIRSYVAGMRLVPEERAFHLVRLAEAAAVIEPTLGRLWAEELFELTANLPPSDNRLVMQKNAVSILSRLAPERALYLLAHMDKPVPTLEDGSLDEDVRSHAARMLFPEIWRKKGRPVLDDLRVLARQMGETGQYPYEAMAPIITDLMATEPATAELLVAEATSFLTQGLHVRHSNYEFAQFLKSVWKADPKPNLRPAVVAFASLLEEELDKRPLGEYRSQIYTSERVVRFESEAAQRLFELMPILRTLDPQRAEQLEDRIAGLRAASAATKLPRRTEGVLIEGAPTSGQISEFERAGFERERFRHIQATVRSDPQAALQLAATISDPALRARALFLVAGAVSEQAPDQASELMKTARQLTDAVEDDRGKVASLTAEAETLDTVGDLRTFFIVFRRAFDLAEELIQEDLDTHPGKPVMFATGFKEAGQLVQMAARLDETAALERIANLRNPALQAYLLIDAARGLYSKPNAEVSKRRP